MDRESIWMRPERSGRGRPPGRSREEITGAAVRVADRDGLADVSMRRVAAELDTGAGSLYRYVETRDDLLDLMADHVVGEYRLTPPSGDWLTDLVALGLQARAVHRRHPWLAELTLTRPVVGPNGVDVTEHFLAVLADHPAADEDKLLAWAMLNAVVASAARAEAAGADTLRSVRYLAHVAERGNHPHLAALRIRTVETDPLPTALERILSGLLP